MVSTPAPSWKLKCSERCTGSGGSRVRIPFKPEFFQFFFFQLLSRYIFTAMVVNISYFTPAVHSHLIEKTLSGKNTKDQNDGTRWFNSWEEGKLAPFLGFSRHYIDRARLNILYTLSGKENILNINKRTECHAC